MIIKIKESPTSESSNSRTLILENVSNVNVWIESTGSFQIDENVDFCDNSLKVSSGTHSTTTVSDPPTHITYTRHCVGLPDYDGVCYLGTQSVAYICNDNGTTIETVRVK